LQNYYNYCSIFEANALYGIAKFKKSFFKFNRLYQKQFGWQGYCSNFHWFTKFIRPKITQDWELERRKRASKMTPIKTTQRGLQDGWTRATFILRKHHLEEIKALAYWERKTIKEVIDEALGSYLKGKIINLREVDK
jgi:hypothetical protein